MIRSFIHQRSRALLVAGAALAVLAGIWGCGSDENAVAPVSQNDRMPEVLDKSNPRVLAVMAVQEKHTSRLMADPEVIGTATTLDDKGQVAVMVMATSQRALAAAPKDLDGVPVVAVYTDKIVALKGGGGGGVSHRAIQNPPISLGTSGGWRYDLANGFCCGGTLGALVNRGGSQYILSNYHVLEADIVNGGNSRTAQAGDPVIQPGLIDVGCNANNSQNVATLSGIKSLPGSNVDAAIAQITPGMVRTDGNILEVGTISSSTVAASVGQAVKKSGRTTGLTRSTVAALNATINVAYENECAGGSAFTKQFTGQIVINNKGSKFLAGGDSGSLMVEDVTSGARAVGLLFAGSTSYGFANPIGQVLSFLNATMVGN